MKFTKLFEAQKLLMERIEKEHPPIEGENRFKKRALALLVEVGECANEFRGFKFWSKDQKPRVKATCDVCDGMGWYKDSFTCSYGCFKCEGTGVLSTKNPLLEELVDILHFVLEMGLVADVVDLDYLELIEFPDVDENLAVDFFLDLYEAIYLFISNPAENYENLIIDFVYLASALGFTWEEVTDAYFQKNQINHRRQDNAY